jgi:hypothetical protein
MALALVAANHVSFSLSFLFLFFFSPFTARILRLLLSTRQLNKAIEGATLMQSTIHA